MCKLAPFTPQIHINALKYVVCEVRFGVGILGPGMPLRTPGTPAWTLESNSHSGYSSPRCVAMAQLLGLSEPQASP